jgi:hypothetical protein
MILTLFISTVFADIQLKSLYDKYPIDVLNKSSDESFSTPLYNSLSLRLRRAEEEKIIENTYALRLSPLAFGQYSQEKELNSEYSKLSRWFHTESSSQTCLEKNMSFVDLYYYYQNLVYTKQLSLVFDDLVSVLKKGITRDITEFNELLKAQEKQVEFKSLVKNHTLVLDEYVKNLKIKTQSDFQVDDLKFDVLVDVDDVKKNFTDFSLRSIEVDKLKTIANIKNLEHEISLKKDEQIVDYFQVSNRSNEDTDERVISFEVGFNIPVLNKRNSVSDIIAKQKALLDYKLAQKEASSEIKGAQTELKNQIKDYEELSNSSYLKNLFDLESYLLKSNLNSPYKILQVKSKIITEKIKLLDLKHEIMTTYFESLLHQGKLKECPENLLFK